jgi:hypothetical protein
LVVSWEDLAWEKILANVDSLLETARAGAVVGRDGSNQRNTKSRSQFFQRDQPCGVPPKCPGKSCLGNRAFLESNSGLENLVR